MLLRKCYISTIFKTLPPGDKFALLKIIYDIDLYDKVYF